MAFHLDILSFCTTVFTRFRYLESTRLLALLQGFDENIIAIDNRLMCRRLPSFSYSIYTVKDFQDRGSLEVIGREQGVEHKLRTCLRQQFLLANGSDTLLSVWVRRLSDKAAMSILLASARWVAVVAMLSETEGLMVRSRGRTCSLILLRTTSGTRLVLSVT